MKKKLLFLLILTMIFPNFGFATMNTEANEAVLLIGSNYALINGDKVMIEIQMPNIVEYERFIVVNLFPVAPPEKTQFLEVQVEINTVRILPEAVIRCDDQRTVDRHFVHDFPNESIDSLIYLGGRRRKPRMVMYIVALGESVEIQIPVV